MGDVEPEVDAMCKQHENPTEWRLRKRFLMKNFGKMDIERLECLSHCFVNFELYGCGYPDKVMDEVSRFGDGVIDSIYPNRN